MTYNTGTLDSFLDRIKNKEEPSPRDKEHIAKIEGRKRHLIDYPHRVTLQSWYEHFDDMDDWCREQFGNMDGPCGWDRCVLGWEYWYNESGLEKQIEDELNSIHSKDVDKESRQKLGSIAIKEHFEMVNERTDSPTDSHGHVGVWRSEWVIKSGYDYGYQDFLFKNKEDAVLFKLHWGQYS